MRTYSRLSWAFRKQSKHLGRANLQFSPVQGIDCLPKGKHAPLFAEIYQILDEITKTIEVGLPEWTEIQKEFQANQTQVNCAIASMNNLANNIAANPMAS